MIIMRDYAYHVKTIFTEDKNMVFDYILISILLIAAVVIVVAVTLQKSGDEGLSGTIAGGSETYYGKDKSARKDRLLGKWTLIATCVFAVVVLVAYVMQPDYSSSKDFLDSWQQVSEFSSIFK